MNLGQPLRLHVKRATRRDGAANRLRRHFRNEVQSEIAHTVPEGDDPGAELQHLIAVLAQR